ncbi:uncharacterized protein BP5553_06868 [Venustampulla echinocandica]|uniref:Uncharacterized protein n=1 Tax=Venustampulla echinocandica TaxID=2656787 RepID=A0A370TL53_9HELO|nr:uncharacterized protein BP5553_06868 [Venustampulla echinocandica]RDL36256.1 hypothetical protein BP5553_06868 [Venustampulla echinocandica]
MMLADELILEIDQYLESESLKVSRLVCRQWCRVATPLLFQRAVLYCRESSQRFKEILGRAHLSRLIKVISFESTYDGKLGELNLIPLIAQPDMLRILPLPTHCDIHNHQTKYITKLARLDSTGDRALTPNLKEIHISTPGIPYLETTVFSNLRRIHIDAESVQLPEDFTFPVLETFHVTCNTLGIEMMIAFLNRHGRLQQLYLTLRITLGPLTEEFLDLIKNELRTSSSEKLVASIIKTAKEDACGESRLFLKIIHRQMTKWLDEELVKELNKKFVTVFGLLIGRQREIYRGALEEIRSAVQNPNAVEMTMAVDYQEGELPRFES